MPSEPPDHVFYRSPREHLEQGDIFQLDLVAPIAHLKPKLFRTVDGRHGSAVFTDQAAAKIFDVAELRDTIAQAPSRTSLHTAPFEISPDGIPEMVVAPAQLAEFFIVASQTCDLSGEGSDAEGFAAVLRVTPLRTLCMHETMPLDGAEMPWVSIHTYLVRKFNAVDLSQAGHDTYTDILRGLINGWRPTTNAETITRNKIKNTVKRLLVGDQSLFFLKKAMSFGLGDMSVDLGTIYTCPISLLLENAHLRKATLVETYRDHFAQKFGLRFSRIAIPVPMVPDDFV